MLLGVDTTMDGVAHAEYMGVHLVAPFRLAYQRQVSYLHSISTASV